MDNKYTMNDWLGDIAIMIENTHMKAGKEYLREGFRHVQTVINEHTELKKLVTDEKPTDG